MLTAWQVPDPRPTRDIDLLGRMEEMPAGLLEAIQMIAAFLYPVTEALLEEQAFQQRWEPGRRWLPQR